ncbi:MAG: hypothetical protein UT05_C0005G0049 [Parcubacteria group bacterium GW2011_GWF2_38_76]|nr:MAG: hypothetical protein UT05_C0005G0049 [Parcubacteria group bacterium GW2011_GWF2_38_76]HBM45619.1 hypothetical protein [Patescibacteria group bacterium]
MEKYWKSSDLEDLEKAKTFEELADIAIRVIKRMPQPVVQVCGPMTTGGKSFKENMEFFENSIKFLRIKGFSVFNQIAFEEAMHRIVKSDYPPVYCRELLEIFYGKILRSGLIKKTFFLPKWWGSRGAIWERMVSIHERIEILPFPQDWVSKINLWRTEAALGFLTFIC